MPQKSRLDRFLSLFTDVRAGEGTTAVLLLVNVFVLLVCYSIVKTVREPLILLGGGAEVRSYTAAGQALVLMAFVPAYSWLAARVGRARLLVSVSAFFIACMELFAAAVTARVPYVGVAFFIWVGVFNISLVAQFWSFAADLYRSETAGRLFPIIMIGMTAGAPLGSLAAGRLFQSGATPPVILQIAAVLLAISIALYAWVDRRESRREPAPVLDRSGGFRLVLASPYLRLVAALIVLLNIVNTTGEYLIARLLTAHVADLAQANPLFDRQAYIGAFSGSYQFWVNIGALTLQAFVASRLVKHAGLRGALLALPLIALGGYAVIAAGAGFGVVRWLKSAENATDYSIMNTARQLVWLPTTREEKYKAKQAIDTFFVRFGDVLSAVVVYAGAVRLHLSVNQFAAVNVALTCVWLAIALRIVGFAPRLPALTARRLAGATAALALLVAAAPVRAQETREELLARERADKAAGLTSVPPDRLEAALERVHGLMSSPSAVYPFVGGVFAGGGLAIGPGYRAQFGDTGRVNAHAAWSVRNYRAVDGEVTLPSMVNGRVVATIRGTWMDAPNVAFYTSTGGGGEAVRSDFAYATRMAGATARVEAAPHTFVGGAFDIVAASAQRDGETSLTPHYGRSTLFAEYDWRSSPRYSRRGGLYRVDFSDYRQTNGGGLGFRRVDMEAQQFVPLLRENWVIALRALASTTSTAAGNEVPYFLLPDLGGGETLRGYSRWRFRDRNRLLMTGEWRWTAGSFVDMALFLDAGTVASKPGDLSFGDLKTAYGVGVSLHTFASTMARVDVARTALGTKLAFSFNPSF